MDWASRARATTATRPAGPSPAAGRRRGHRSAYGGLIARLRAGRANTVLGAANFLRETVGRVRDAGATGQLTVRVDSGFYTRAIVAVCRKFAVRYSIIVRWHPSLRNLIEAIPEEDWTPISYGMNGAADMAETEYTPFESKTDAATILSPSLSCPVATPPSLGSVDSG